MNQLSMNELWICRDRAVQPGEYELAIQLLFARRNGVTMTDDEANDLDQFLARPHRVVNSEPQDPPIEKATVVDPTDPGYDVLVLREHVRHLERRVRELHVEHNARIPRGQPVALARWGKAEPGAGLLLQRRVDGYWTEWHIAQAALDFARGRVARGTCDSEALQWGVKTLRFLLKTDDPVGPHAKFEEAVQQITADMEDDQHD